VTQGACGCRPTGQVVPPQNHRHTQPMTSERSTPSIHFRTTQTSHSSFLSPCRVARAAHIIIHRVSMSAASSSSGSSAIFPSWHFAFWTAVDDRVRGGSSRSHLDPVEVEVKGKSTKAARFWGILGEDGDFRSHSSTPAPDVVQISKRSEALASLRSGTSSDLVPSVFPETSSKAYASPSSPTSSLTSSLQLRFHYMPEPLSPHTSPSSSKRRYGPTLTRRRSPRHLNLLH
jgi:hypothetical protein